MHTAAGEGSVVHAWSQRPRRGTCCLLLPALALAWRRRGGVKMTRCPGVGGGSAMQEGCHKHHSDGDRDRLRPSTCDTRSRMSTGRSGGATINGVRARTRRRKGGSWPCLCLWEAHRALRWLRHLMGGGVAHDQRAAQCTQGRGHRVGWWVANDGCPWSIAGVSNLVHLATSCCPSSCCCCGWVGGGGIWWSAMTLSLMPWLPAALAVPGHEWCCNHGKADIFLVSVWACRRNLQLIFTLRQESFACPRWLSLLLEGAKGLQEGGRKRERPPPCTGETRY